MQRWFTCFIIYFVTPAEISIGTFERKITQPFSWSAADFLMENSSAAKSQTVGCQIVEISNFCHSRPVSTFSLVLIQTTLTVFICCREWSKNSTNIWAKIQQLFVYLILLHSHFSNVAALEWNWIINYLYFDFRPISTTSKNCTFLSITAKIESIMTINCRIRWQKCVLKCEAHENVQILLIKHYCADNWSSSVYY